MIKGFLKAIVWVGIPVAAIIFALDYFFVDIAVIGHDGMAPTLLEGEQVFFWKGAPERMGAIAICRHPINANEIVIGRVFGRPGMEIKEERGRMWIAGTRLEMDLVDGKLRYYDADNDRTIDVVRAHETMGNVTHETIFRREMPLRMRPTQVKRGLFLLNDNRTMADHDSRTFGEVDPETCLGSVFMRYTATENDPNSFGHGGLEFVR